MTGGKCVIKFGSRRSIARFVPYLTWGLVICAGAQIAFWLELLGPGIWSWPFIWAYLQQSLIWSTIPKSDPLIQALVWMLCYLLLALIMYLVVERGSLKRRSKWYGRPLLAWLCAQILVSASVWLLALSGIVRLE